MKKIVQKCLSLAFLLPAFYMQAKEYTPVEAFIAHTKEANTFVPVTNLWQPDQGFDKTTLQDMVERAQPLSVDFGNVAGFMKQQYRAINLVVPGPDGVNYTIELARYDFLTNDFQVHEMGENGADKLVGYTPGLYYRGVVSGIQGSVAAFSFFNNEMYGIFSIPNVGNIVVAPNTMVGKDYDYNTHYLVYNDRELKIKFQGDACAADKLPLLKRAQKTTTTVGNKVYNSCTEIRCFETADYSMYVKKGSSTANSTNYMTALFNNKATLYLNEGIMVTLKYTQVNTASDQYQSLPASSGRWLNKFGWVTQTTMHGCDVATLFATKYGTMGGVAWLGTLCMGYFASDSAGPYAFCNLNNSASTTVTPFPTYSWDVEVSTHEMGHVLGSPHTHACVWNPPGTGSTAIDACYTLEGSCPTPSPAYPAAGGTIMSYCHLVSSVGINFSNGFGSQPGDTIRYYTNQSFSSTCGNEYKPAVANQLAARTISANRECTDATGTTYYWYDNNTADHTDDTLVLMVMKNGNNIGTLNSSSFSVTSGTITGYGGGTGQSITFPTGVAGLSAHNISMRRYWNIIPATQPTSAVEVIFPFMLADTVDVDGSIPGVPMLHDYRFYKVNNPVDPTPGAGFTGATAANFTIFTYASAPATNKWSFSTTTTLAGGTTYLAHMKMTNLSGGGTGFYTYNTAAVNGVPNVNAETGIVVYPNPTDNQWFVSVAKHDNEVLTFQLFTADGRLAYTRILENGALNTVNAATLPSGIYFYRITGSANMYTGTLRKN